MNYESRYQKTTKRRPVIAEEMILNIWEISQLNPCQLISSDLISFFDLPGAQINVFPSSVLLIWIYFWIPAFLPSSPLFCLLCKNCDIYSLLASCENRQLIFHFIKGSRVWKVSKAALWCDITVFFYSHHIPVRRPRTRMIVTLT